MSGWCYIEEDIDHDYFMVVLGAKEYGIVNWMINDGKLGLLGPIGEVKESPKSHILGFMNYAGNLRRQWEKN